jgi:hypothetical protein
MPAGYGVHDGGRSTKAERSVIATAPISGPDATALTNSAAHLVHRLVAARALKSKDVTKPLPAQLRGPLRFCVAAYDPSGNHAATQCAHITISAHG